MQVIDHGVMLLTENAYPNVDHAKIWTCQALAKLSVTFGSSMGSAKLIAVLV